MVCAACGCEQVAEQFCKHCGMKMGASAPVGAAAAAGVGTPAVPPPPAYQAHWAGYPYAALVAEQRMRVRQNLQPLGIMWIMFGGYRILMGLFGALMVHTFVHGGMFSDAPPFLPHLMGSLVPILATVSVVMGAGAIFTGWALLSRQPWGRTVAIVFGVLALIKIPFGTALGIYTLWVLAPSASWAEWESLKQA